MVFFPRAGTDIEIRSSIELIILYDISDSIYHDEGTGILFATFKYVGYDYAGDMERMRGNPKVREWWAMTDGFQEVYNFSLSQVHEQSIENLAVLIRSLM